MSSARKPCPWHTEALKFAQVGKTFVALSPRENPKAWAAWRDYFRWLNWAPFWFIEVERKHDEDRGSPTSWTAPIDHPDRFTVRFEPVKGPPPMFPLTMTKRSGPPGPAPGHIQRMRERGALTFKSAGESKQDKHWFRDMPQSAAQAFLDKHNHERPADDGF